MQVLVDENRHVTLGRSEMYVTWLEIKQLRCFEHANVSLLYPGKPDVPDKVLDNMNLLLGVNGAGKTTILKALALAVLAPVLDYSGFVPYCLVRRVKRPPARRKKPARGPIAKATIEAGAVEANGHARSKRPREETLSVSIQRHGSSERVSHSGARESALSLLEDDNSPVRFMTGYGATRRVESAESVDPRSRKRRMPRYQRVAGLFEEYIALMPLGPWLVRLKSSKPRRYSEIVHLLDHLLPQGTRFEGRFEGLEALFLHQGLLLPFGALSDGYRAYIGLLGDLIYHLQSVCPTKRMLTDLPGVVLIDDVDLQLHPEWQRVVVPTLARTFPRLQFVMTSHSPIIAGTLHSKNVVVLHSEGGISTVQTSTHRLHGLNADQIAISPYFGLPTTRAADEVDKLRALSAQTRKRGDTARAIEYLNELAGTNSE
jgi:energy-coupling factor transporter ATP-binding protein EcfA2